MARVIVIGAGLGGLSTAALLAMDGHDVTVLERDPQPPLEEAERCWTGWERRGVNQFRLPHYLLPRWRQLLEHELPDVATALVDRGALRFEQIRSMPTELTGGVRPDDDQFTALTARRPVLEAGFASTAERIFGVHLRRGVGVAGLLTGDPSLPGVPHVTGVRTEDGEELHADLVVDSGGRRSALPQWLTAVGARTPHEELEDSGFVYFGRHFRGSDRPFPEVRALLLQAYDSISLLTLPSDRGTWCVAFVASAADRELRGLRHPDRWHEALRLYPLAAHWGAGEPISDVQVMAGIPDRYRRFVVDGTPVATGIAAVADAWACTNPSLGRGATMALLHTCALRDLLREVPVTDPVALACRWDELTEATVTPIYRATLAFDRHRLGELEAARLGQEYETDDPTWAITRAFAAAAYADPSVLRQFLRVMSLTATPLEVMGEPGLIEQIMALAGSGDGQGLPGADRATLLAAVNG